MKTVFRGLLAVLVVVGLFCTSGPAAAQSYEQQQLLRELQHQRWIDSMEQRRQFEEQQAEQQHQRSMDEINRMQRNNPLNELYQEMLRDTIRPRR